MKGISRKKVIKNISWLVFDKVFVLLVGLFVIIRIANFYGPSEYGLYQYALSINTLLGVLILFVDGRVVKKQFQEQNEGHIIYNTTLAKVILSCISLVIGAVVLLIVSKGINFNIIYIMLLVNNILINLGFGIQTYFEYKLMSKNVVIAANIAIVISSLFQLTAIGMNYSIIVVVMISLASSLIKLLLLFFQFKKSFSIPLIDKSDKLLILAIIKESIPLTIAAAAATIYTRIDQVMIGAMLNVKEVGIYSISNNMISVVAMAIGPIQISIFPKMIEWYNNNRDLYYKKYQAITSFTTWLYIVGTIFTYIVAPTIFNMFFSEDYIKSLDVFKIQVIGTFFMYNAALRSSHFTLTKNTYVMMISQIVAVLINIILNYLLIPIIGVYGAAVATAITQFVSLFISNLFFETGKEVFWLQLKGINPFYMKMLK